MLDDRSLTTAVINVPYVVGWREHDDPLTTATVPPALRSAIAQLSAAAAMTVTQPVR